MAEQYVVNNASLVATADAIRTKSGNTSGIEWNSSTGFASAIEGISSEAQVVTGTVTVNAEICLRNNGVPVYGVGFTPKKLILYRTSEGIAPLNLSMNNYYVCCVESGEPRTDLGAGLYSCYATACVCDSSGNYSVTTVSQVVLHQMSEQDYLLMQWFEGGTDAYMVAGTYNWIAVG